jgi:hypothetical protein
MPTVYPEDRCDVCHEPALLADSDVVVCPCRAELWVHDRCAEASGPCPTCGRRWTADELIAEEPRPRRDA